MAIITFSPAEKSGNPLLSPPRSAAPAATRSVILACADGARRGRLAATLRELRWIVREAGGAAEALAAAEQHRTEALITDLWLPDLEATEFATYMQVTYPYLEIVRIDGTVLSREQRSEHRHELLAGIRLSASQAPDLAVASAPVRNRSRSRFPKTSAGSDKADGGSGPALPKLLGSSASMRELTDLIRLVAPRDTSVLIEGQTGTGKEVVAHLLHAMSSRSDKPLVILNCAAIPEALLEAELFGHTRGAFTGAVQSRMGRIETADGGTLFLDEIGEMPLGLQAKMLRFLECGELQRVGDNTVAHVDVRILAATHQPLEQRSEEGSFRLDLYHRLAVFPVEVPPLIERMDDLPELAEHFLDRLGRETPRKRLTPDALEELLSHRWPGNVRELMHVIERATILSGDSLEIARTHIRIRKRERA